MRRLGFRGGEARAAGEGSQDQHLWVGEAGRGQVRGKGKPGWEGLTGPRATPLQSRRPCNCPPLAVCWRLTLAEGHCCPLGGSQQHSLAPIAPMKSVVDHSRETGIEKLLRREVL